MKVLAGPLLLLCPPLTLVLSMVGLANDNRKEYAIATLLLSGAIIAAFLLLLH